MVGEPPEWTFAAPLVWMVVESLEQMIGEPPEWTFAAPPVWMVVGSLEQMIAESLEWTVAEDTKDMVDTGDKVDKVDTEDKVDTDAQTSVGDIEAPMVAESREWTLLAPDACMFGECRKRSIFVLQEYMFDERWERPVLAPDACMFGGCWKRSAVVLQECTVVEEKKGMKEQADRWAVDTETQMVVAPRESLAVKRSKQGMVDIEKWTIAPNMAGTEDMAGTVDMVLCVVFVETDGHWYVRLVLWCHEIVLCTSLAGPSSMRLWISCSNDIYMRVNRIFPHPPWHLHYFHYR
jgi:hypothetical protein